MCYGRVELRPARPVDTILDEVLVEERVSGKESADVDQDVETFDQNIQENPNPHFSYRVDVIVEIILDNLVGVHLKVIILSNKLIDLV